jgi:amino acid transporter
MDWVSLLIDFAVYMVSMAICAIIMLSLIGSMAGSFLRLQKLRNWLITQEHKHRKLSAIVFMLCIFSVIMIFDLGIISGIIGGFFIAITFDPVPKEKTREHEDD